MIYRVDDDLFDGLKMIAVLNSDVKSSFYRGIVIIVYKQYL